MSQLDALLEVVSPRTGILKSLTLRAKGADQPSLPYIYEGMLSHFDFRKVERMERASCGKGLTEEAAKLGAIGEAIERYCAAHPAAPEMRRATLAAMSEAGGDEVVAPAEFVLFSEAQYKRQNLSVWQWKPTDEILWARMSEAGSDRQVWVPAVFVYLSHASDQLQDLLCAPNSSGFAAGPDEKSALRSAILELIERDAFMINWLARTPGLEIETAGVGGIIGDICSTYGRWGTEVRAFALATDMPATVVMAIALDRTGDGPAAVVGLGCESSPREALRKSLFEICQMHEPLCRRHREGTAARLNAYTDVKTIDDHAAYFFRRDHLHEFDFLLQGARKVRIGDLADYSAESGVDPAPALAARGYRVFHRDLTTPDLMSYPIRVARALIPQLQPITFGHGQERLGGRRLYERGAISESSLNPCPHPLA